MAAPAITTSNQYPDRRYTATIPVSDMTKFGTLTVKLAVPHAFRVDAVRWRQGMTAATSGGTGAVTATLKIAGTAASGGVVSIGQAAGVTDTCGAKIDGTAITGGNTGAAGDTLEFTFATGTAYTAGAGWLEATVVDTSLGAQSF